MVTETENLWDEKDAMVEKQEEILPSQKDAPIFMKWSLDDETFLSKLTSESITLADTALGRQLQLIEKGTQYCY